jgi:hypothetical protein
MADKYIPMNVHFVNMLVPVDLHPSDEKAIEIAIQMADPRFCVIHLLDVVRPNILSFFLGLKSIGHEISGIESHRFVKEILYLRRMKATIEQFSPNTVVKIHLSKSRHLQDAVASFANRLCVQMVILPETENRGRYTFRENMSPEDIAGKTHCKVMAYKRGVLSIVEKGDPFATCAQVRKNWERIQTGTGYFCDN